MNCIEQGVIVFMPYTFYNGMRKNQETDLQVSLKMNCL